MKKTKIVPIHYPSAQLAPYQDPQAAGELVNQLAARAAFLEYRRRRRPQTLRRQQADLDLFADYLVETRLRRRPANPRDTGPGVLGDLSSDPDAWQHITWGIIQGFREWMLSKGYAIGSVNVRLSTVRVYAGLAVKAGVIPQSEWSQIQSVKGYAVREINGLSQKDGKHFGEQRIGLKKAEPARITDAQAWRLKNEHPDTPTGRRNRALMCLLLDHGLRVGEVVRIRAEKIDRENGLMEFERPKVSKSQIHQLSEDSLTAINLLFDSGDIQPGGPLLRKMNRNRQPTQRGLSEQGANSLVGELGRAVGIANLSPHDCRHYWATLAAESGTDPFALQEAGGWNSLTMPRRYIERQKISNARVVLKPKEKKSRRYALDTDAKRRRTSR